MLKVGLERCPFCYKQNIYISAPKHLWEELAILVLLQPVRCHDCMRRFLRPLFASPPAKSVVRSVESKEAMRKETTAPDRRRAA
jgi:hypothetical protein